jgi:hypothetical protein
MNVKSARFRYVELLYSNTLEGLFCKCIIGHLIDGSYPLVLNPTTQSAKGAAVSLLHKKENYKPCSTCFFSLLLPNHETLWSPPLPTPDHGKLRHLRLTLSQHGYVLDAAAGLSL